MTADDEYNAALASILRSKGWQPVWCHNADGNVWALKDTTGPAPFGQEGQQPSGYTLSFRPPQSVKIFDVDHYDEKHGISAMMRTTGYSLSITGQMQARKEVGPPGVWTPDECIPAKRYIDELRKRGMDVRETATG